MQLRLLRDRRGCLRSSLYLLARLAIFTLSVLVRDAPLAQAPGGVISGVVDDVTGAVVAKASLRITHGSLEACQILAPSQTTIRMFRPPSSPIIPALATRFPRQLRPSARTRFASFKPDASASAGSGSFASSASVRIARSVHGSRPATVAATDFSGPRSTLMPSLRRIPWLTVTITSLRHSMPLDGIRC
jgi:hypothetical protein